MRKGYLPFYYPNFVAHICEWFLLRYRKKQYGSEFLRIKLFCGKKFSKNQYAIIDPEDYWKISKYDWLLCESKSKKFYAVRLADWGIVNMHRDIINAPTGKVIDHIDRNGLNNTKRNLRIASISQNGWNRTGLNNHSSKYKGVCWCNRRKKWRASIKYNGIYKHLGYFKTEEDAAKTYDEAAKKYHGEFGVLNFEQDKKISHE
ncbi:MAG: Pathogenesis-related transcriptional factor and ERF protein [Candidatus Uhrbacteria bacterium GW2011_GWF2_41_16]|uniref:Pathogenesis-related transcriptional factor and ERF protein n=1 Tax=Candidatus Uhrbacteria bacterium GW2011_GWF2_41_16 TaxID=1618997 RepID=A0A0G0V808_9BACT|nr:MAG: Pathogenesis-related transcriptional factor and ERF protein [Candidatus Uhrbacteria bacterium GW2011_GWF2_41_16]